MMDRNSVAFAISGTMFGLLVGWILGTQQGGATPTVAAPAAQAAQQAAAPAPPPLDVQRAAALERQANAEPANAAVRVDLGNLYFDAERYDLATSWYEAALKIAPNDVNASTDLAVSYYQQNLIEQSLAQFERSLAIDPTHTKTLLNRGIVRAYGKQDFDGAIASWEQLIAIAPNSPEAATAREVIAGVKANHPAAAAGGGGGTRP